MTAHQGGHDGSANVVTNGPSQWTRSPSPVERAQQNQALNTGNTTNYNQELLNEIQRQQLSLAQQNLELQRRVLEMQKTIDRLVEQNQKTEKAPAPAKPEESAKPKSTPRKP